MYKIPLYAAARRCLTPARGATLTIIADSLQKCKPAAGKNVPAGAVRGRSTAGDGVQQQAVILGHRRKKRGGRGGVPGAQGLHQRFDILKQPVKA